MNITSAHTKVRARVFGSVQEQAPDVVDSRSVDHTVDIFTGMFAGKGSFFRYSESLDRAEFIRCGQMMGLNKRALDEYKGVLQGPFQFTHIAGQVVLHEKSHDRIVIRANLFA